MFPNPRLLNLARRSGPWLALTISLGFLAGLLTILQARWLSQLISRVFLEGAGLGDVSRLLQGILAAFTLRAILSWGSSLSGKTIAIQTKSRVQTLLLEKLTSLGPVYLQGERSGELSNTATAGVEALDAYFSQYLPQLVLSALVPLTILIFVFPRDLLSGVVLLVTAPLIPFFMVLIGSGAQKVTDRQYSSLSRLAARFLDSLQGLKTLKLFNQASEQVNRIRAASEEYRLTTMKVLQVTFLSALVLELLATLSTAVVAVQIGLRLLYFQTTLAQALFILIIAPEFYIPLRMLGLRFHAGMEGQSAAERIFQILDAGPITDQEPQNEAQFIQAPALESLEFQGVSLRYPGQQEPALQDLDLDIQPGQQIALVGASGAGKSTLASLLLGFITPTSGRILVNGIDLADLDAASWREKLAWVPQRPALFQDTIAANIRLARPDADDGAVAAAAAAAHLADFIDSLPEGYGTVIGEGGARLSGGQAQRLALARAFLKDAPILLLDEPTSQLDPITETQLADATRRLMAGRTVITIAHRLNTVFKADRILLLHEGRIAASGTHSQLLAASEYYRQTVRAYTGLERFEIGGLPDGVPDRWEIKPQDPLPPDGAHSGGSPEDLPAASRKPITRLLSFFEPHLKGVLASVLLGTMTIASSVGLMGASAWLIVTAATHPNIAVLQVAIVGVRFFGISRGISRYLERLASHDLTFKILTDLRVWFYQSLLPLAPARTSQYRSGDLLSRITADIRTLEDFYVRSLAPPLVALLVGVGTGAFFYRYHPGLAWLLGGLFLASGLLVPAAVRLLARKPGRDLIRTRAELSSRLLSYIQGLPDLLLFGQAGAKMGQVEEIRRRFSRSELALARVSGLNAGTLVFFSNLGLWLVLVAAVPLVRSGEIPGAMLAALALMALSAFEAIQPLPQAMETLASTREAGSRLLEILDAEPAVRDPVQPAPLPAEASLQVRDLAFRYPGSGAYALQGIEFQLKQGELLAVVGPSGSGKTTLANLLLRFWGGYQGKITLGAEALSLDLMSQEEVRRQFSVVSQNPDIFQDTLRDNIALARPGASQEQIRSAADQAHLTGVIDRLPEGWDTWMGERGSRFSAGENQRVAIARAVLKDAPFFLLDEPTANLDPVTEKEILDILFANLAGKAALLITHRLVGLGRADWILVLRQGQIVESGTEAQLLSRKGFYHQMWSLQNRILAYS